MINFNNVTLTYGRQVLFANASFTLHDKHKVGLIGKNGSGKSSLFALLLNKLQPADGEISYQGQLTIASVAQEFIADHTTAIDYVLQGDEPYWQLHQQIQTADEGQLAELYQQLDHIDGFSAPARAAQLLAGLGFSNEQQQLPTRHFSGGWQMRLNLARALMCRSDVLLLDEPTNHLDLDAILWLEKWLTSYQGLLLVISHDRDFLDKIVLQILSIKHQQIKLFNGNYSQYEKIIAEQLATQQATYEKQQRTIAHLQHFVDRFRYKASKAKQAQSRLKAIARIEQVAAVQSETPFSFSFETAGSCPYPLLTLKDADLGYADKTILRKVNWQLVPEQRVALLGPNGAGKSTLIKSLVGQLPLIHGTLTIDNKVKVGYFSQQQVATLSLEQNAMSHLQKLDAKLNAQQIRNFLGGFGFSGDQVLVPVAHYSGGEKARLSLALITYQKPNLLLLDEPTNHLDMEMRNALMLALQSFDGALVIVSHDRYLLRHCVDQLYLVANHAVVPFDGDLDDYKQWLLKHYQQNEPKSSATQPVANKTKTKKVNPQFIAELEKNMQHLENDLAQISLELAKPELYENNNRGKREALYSQQQQLQQQLLALEQQWLESMEGAD